MVSRYLQVTLLAVLGFVLPYSVAHAQMQEGTHNERLFEYDANHPAYKDIVKEASLGRQHIEGPIDYGTDFPTSGPHNPVWADPGFYDEPVNLWNLVHSLEHGNIVIYYDQPNDATMRLIRGWTDKFQGQWDGVIAVPYEGLGEGIVMTSWRHRLELEKVDVRAAFFVDAFRGRGPENRVR